MEQSYISDDTLDEITKGSKYLTKNIKALKENEDFRAAFADFKKRFIASRKEIFVNTCVKEYEMSEIDSSNQWDAQGPQKNSLKYNLPFALDTMNRGGAETNDATYTRGHVCRDLTDVEAALEPDLFPNRWR